MLSADDKIKVVAVADAFGIGMSVEKVFELTKIDPWFLAQIKDLVDTELAIEKREKELTAACRTAMMASVSMA